MADLVTTPPAAPTLAEAVAALKAFVKDLSRRRDIVVKQKYLGRNADQRYLKGRRARQADGGPRYNFDSPNDLVNLREYLNGVLLIWEFKDGSGGGRLCIKTIYDSALDRFLPDGENFNDFGPGKLSCLFDSSQDEYATWFVAEGLEDIPHARLLVAEQGEGDAGTPVANSIAEYLLKALSAAFSTIGSGAPTRNTTGARTAASLPKHKRVGPLPGRAPHQRLRAHGGGTGAAAGLAGVGRARPPVLSYLRSAAGRLDLASASAE